MPCSDRGCCVDAGSLIVAGKKHIAPVGGAAVGHSTITQRDEPREVLVGAAESVEHPTPEAWPGKAQIAGVHEDSGGFVGRDVGIHRFDDAQSSALFWRAGKSSLISKPPWPHLSKRNGLAKPTLLPPGNVLPSYLANSGLWSTWDGPPLKNMDDVLSFGREMNGHAERPAFAGRGSEEMRGFQ